MYNIDYRQTSVSIMCAFIHYLTTQYDKSSTILNYVSSLASVLRRLGVSTLPFASINVQDFIMSIKTNISHIPFKSAPVTFHMLSQIIDVVLTDPHGRTIAFALLLMYFSFLRQSNLSPRNKSAFDASQHLTRGDVLARQKGLVVALKWSKTRQTSLAATTAVPALDASSICPVRSYHEMLRDVPTIRDSQPLIAFKDCSSMPVTYLCRIWASALTSLGADPGLYSLHSLRRGGATDIYTQGTASLQQIKFHGDWTSNAVYHYLPNDPTTSAVFSSFRDLC